MATEGNWGITPPISMNLPTAAESNATNALFEELKRQGTFETSTETQKREKVLESLQKMCDEFVKRIARERFPHNEVLIRDARGEIFTYGSYCLGVYGPGSDIDTLITAPKYVTREDYFRVFPDLLQEMAPKGAVTELAVVADAFVPIITFEFWSISIDLIFSRIATLQQFPEHKKLQLTNNEYLRGLDEAELRSLNGTRVTNEILNLVPEKSTFRLALRAIKLWAQRRAIYANIIGFPGGVVWAMLVARVCQLYPKAAAAVIVSKFFQIMSRWPWPQPVQLKHPDEGPLNVRVWNPKKYKGDSFHLMPVITPAYPQMCATYNITHSAKAIIQKELVRAGQIADRILSNGAPWSQLFVKHTFFTQGYKYYLAVIATTKKSKDSHRIWAGFVESKVRVLVSNLERHPSIALAHPFNKGFDRSHKISQEAQFEIVMNGSLDFLCPEDKEDSAQKEPAEANNTTDAANGVDAAKPATAAGTDGDKSAPEDKVDSNDDMIYTSTHYIGLDLAEGAKSLDLSYQVNEFKELCLGWDKCEQETNFLSVQHVKNVKLPDDVFEPGEEKPKPLKKAGAANPAQKKRPAPPEDSKQASAKRQQTSQAPVAAAG